MRRTQQERRDETERRVVDAALALIERHGTHQLTLAQVGTAAGYSRGIVHHRFGGREQLLAAVVRDAQHFALPDASGDGLGRLEAFVRRYLVNLGERSTASRAFLRMWGEAIGGDPVLVPLFVEQDDRFRTYVEELVRIGVEDGSIRADAEREAVGTLVVGLLRGIGMQFISAAPPDRLDAVADDAARWVVLALGTGTAAEQRT